MLQYMVERNGQLVTHARLLEGVWLYKFIPESALHTVNGLMSHLRRKVDGSDEAPMIRNVRGEGFIFDAMAQARG